MRYYVYTKGIHPHDLGLLISNIQQKKDFYFYYKPLFCKALYLFFLLYFQFQVIEVMRNPKDKADSKYNPDIGISKEDEERYQKLVSENEDLQKLIAQVSHIVSLKCSQKCFLDPSIKSIFHVLSQKSNNYLWVN